MEQKAFGRFGMEPTFYPDISNYPAWWNRKNRHGDSAWEDVTGALTDNLRKHKLRHAWWKQAETDENVLEVPTTVYDSYEVFKKDWKSLERLLKKYEFFSSSSICMEAEGGCHINMSLSKLPHKKNYLKVLGMKRHGSFWHGFTDEQVEIPLSYRELFCINFIRFMASHPALVWSCLSPHDNVSSQIPEMAFRPAGQNFYLRKGHFATIRSRSGSMRDMDDTVAIDRIEMRFFMMPRNEAELDFHYALANAIMWHIKEITDRVELLELRGTYKGIKNTKFKAAQEDLKQVFEKIGVSYSDFVDLGKEALLKERFSYGSKYIV